MSTGGHSWNKGLTKATSPGLARVAAAKAEWWRTHDTTETRKKIGQSSKGRIQPGPKHPSWKGGRHTDARDGYVHAYAPDHPAAIRNGKGNGPYVLEHRLVMEGVIGRYLRPEEEVHHINGIKDDNRPENLRLVLHASHYGRVRCPHCGEEFDIK